MITDIAGVRVGHWTDPEARTGCTVVLLPEGTVASGEVRGGAPATREFALLEPSRMIQRLDAVVLTGGSAFGLASAHGAMEVLAERGQGFETAGGVVPIVVAMGIFDLAVGDGSVRPGAAEGRAAAEAAVEGPHAVGAVGAGTGATIAKWRGAEHRRPGALVADTVRAGDLVVSTLIVVNAFGEPGASSEVVAGLTDPARGTSLPSGGVDPGASFTNTTVGVVVTNAAIDKVGCHLVAQSAHHGLARSVAPSHTAADGDAFVVAATGEIEAPVADVRALATAAVERAIGRLADGSLTT